MGSAPPVRCASREAGAERRDSARSGSRFGAGRGSRGALVGVLVWAAWLNPPAADAQAPTGSRHVTVFGILASPSDRSLDPRLKPIEHQLRRLFPDHGFKLVGVDTRRLGTGQSQVFELGGDFEAQVQLLNAFDAQGKTQLRFELDNLGQLEFATVLTTPLNQLSFCDRRFGDGSRLVIGVGVRD